MSDQNADVNVIRVDTGAMREAAIAINNNLNAIDTAVQELGKILNAFNPNTADEATWLGSTATLYAETYQKLLGDVAAISIKYAFLADDLNQHAEEYERAHGIAMAAAESIEPITWAHIDSDSVTWAHKAP
jgi:uncharacterized protein YukE